MSQRLDPAALISLLPTLLPQSDTVLKNSHDAITSLVHTAMSALAFRLTAVDDQSSSTYENNVLPVGWNKLGPGNYTLKYKHEQSSLEFVIKLSRMSSRMLINAIALEVCCHTLFDLAICSLPSRRIKLLLSTSRLKTLLPRLFILTKSGARLRSP